MGKAEIRDAFEAYASGKLSEYELRSALRVALQAEPESVSIYAAMVAALRLRKLISAELEAAVVSDIKALTGDTGETPPEYEGGPERNLPPTLRHLTSAGSSEAVPPAEPHSSIPIATTGRGSGRSTGPGSAWDTQERLAEPEAQVMIGLVLRERFELVEELGRGGMGVVYKALDQREVENMGREPYVAIKVLNEEFKRHPESARALQRESKKSMRLAHPNIVLVRDFDRDRGNVFMVMELLNGQPLDRLQRNQYPNGMPIDKVTDIVSGLGAGLSYAHQQGIVHADFKPSNTFLTNQNVVKVLDFGVARAARALDRAESTLFDAGKLNAITPAYASVEMLIGEAPDPRDDIYALACVTYLLLTGRHPYNGIDAVKAREAALLPPPIEGIADHQWSAIYWALTFERASRTATVKEFVAQFCTDQSPRPIKRAGEARREPRVSAARTGAIKAADAAVREPRLFAARTQAIKLAAAAVRNRWIAARTRAIKLAGAAVRKWWVAARTRASRLAGAAAGRPRLMAAPAGVLLAAAVALFVPREWYAHMRSEMSVLIKVQPFSEASMPVADSSPSIRQPKQRLASINPVPTDVKPQAPSETSNAPTDSSPSVPQPEQRLAPIKARSHQRLDEARQVLALGQSAGQQSPDATRAEAEIAEQQPNTEAAKRSTPVDGIGKLKQQLADQAAAGDVDGATATANAMQRALGGTAYASNELQQQLIESYVRLAKKQLTEGNPELALQTIASGRKRFASAPDLKNLEITYDRVEEEVARINMAPSLSVRDHTGWLEEIRQLSGADFPDIEQMLARALANDIADQRAKGDRPSVVANLLESGRKVFPEYATLLEQGKAGVLDPAQIAAAEAPLDPDNTPAGKEKSQVAQESPVLQPTSAK